MMKRLLYVLTSLVTTAVFALTGSSAMAATIPAVSPNWAGYQATAADAHTASAHLVQPAISCAAKDSSSDVAIFVGVGSKRSFGGLLPGGKTLAQVGTWAFCYKGKAGYLLFWETVGRSASEGGGGLEPVWAGPSPLTPPSTCKPSTASGNQLLAYLVGNGCTESLKPGDHLTLDAQVAAGEWAYFGASDSRTGFVLNTTQTFTGAEANAANWIVESPSVNGNYSPLAKFGKVTFSDCQVYSGTTLLPISGLSNAQIHMISGLILPIRATTSGLTAKGTQFSVTWKNS